MSLRATQSVWKNSKAKGSARLVLLCIAEYFNDEKGGAWPSFETISDMTKVSKRQVSRAITELKNLGEIDTLERGLGRGNSYFYTILLPMEPVKKDDTVSLKDDKLTPFEVEPPQIKDDICDTKDDKLSKKGDMMSTDPLVEPLNNPLVIIYSKLTGDFPNHLSPSYESGYLIPAAAILDAACGDIEKAKSAIGSAHELLLRKRYTISSLKSLQRTAIGELKRITTAPPQPNKHQTLDKINGLLQRYGRRRGPKSLLADGEITQQEAEIIKRMGGWHHICGQSMDKNKFAFYEAFKAVTA